MSKKKKKLYTPKLATSMAKAHLRARVLLMLDGEASEAD